MRVLAIRHLLLKILVTVLVLMKLMIVEIECNIEVCRFVVVDAAVEKMEAEFVADAVVDEKNIEVVDALSHHFQQHQTDFLSYLKLKFTL